MCLASARMASLGLRPYLSSSAWLPTAWMSAAGRGEMSTGKAATGGASTLETHTEQRVLQAEEAVFLDGSHDEREFGDGGTGTRLQGGCPWGYLGGGRGRGGSLQVAKRHPMGAPVGKAGCPQGLADTVPAVCTRCEAGRTRATMVNGQGRLGTAPDLGIQ